MIEQTEAPDSRAENATPVQTDGEKMTWDDIDRITVGEIDAAVDYIEQHKAPDRIEKWNRYYGEPLGNEVKGRSQFMTRDVMDTIEWIMPTLIRTFASGDSKVDLTIEGQPLWAGKALMQRIQDDLATDDDNNLFLAFYAWMKDALVSDTAFIKISWDLDYEKKTEAFPSLQREQMAQLMADPDIQVDSAEEGFFGYQNVRITAKAIKRDGPRVDNIPHWEFITGPKARSMNDEHGKGHMTEVSVDYLKRINRAHRNETGEDFFQGLDNLEVREGQKSSIGGEPVIDGAERSNYYRDMDNAGFYKDVEDTKGPKAQVVLTEWYTRLDVDGDGFLEDVVVWNANGKMIGWAINEDGFIPLCGISPVLDCYKFFGIAYADLLVEIQNLKTLLFRRILDNFDYQNLGRWFVAPGGQKDIRALLDNVPGDVIRMDPSQVVNMPAEPFNPMNLSLLEYIDTIKENRTGSTRYNQGTDSDSLNKTARGIAMIQSAAQQRIDLVARIFAETGLKDFYYKCARLYQQHIKKPFTVTVKGQEREITPDMIQGRIKAKVDMGIEAQAGVVESQKIERMFAFLGQMSQQYPGLIGPEQIHNLAVRYVTSMGFKAHEEYINSLEGFMKELQARMAQAQQAQQMQMQFAQQQAQQEAAMEQGKLQIEGAKVQGDQRLEGQKIHTDQQMEDRKLQAEVFLTQQEIAQKERDSIRDMQVAMAKAGI